MLSSVKLINLFYFGRLSFWSSSILVLFYFGPLPFCLSSSLVIFHFVSLPFWSSSILVVLHFGHLPFSLSSILDWQSVVALLWSSLILENRIKPTGTELGNIFSEWSSTCRLPRPNAGCKRQIKHPKIILC